MKTKNVRKRKRKKKTGRFFFSLPPFIPPPPPDHATAAHRARCSTHPSFLFLRQRHPSPTRSARPRPPGGGGVAGREGRGLPLSACAAWERRQSGDGKNRPGDALCPRQRARARSPPWTWASRHTRQWGGRSSPSTPGVHALSVAGMGGVPCATLISALACSARTRARAHRRLRHTRSHLPPPPPLRPPSHTQKDNALPPHLHPGRGGGPGPVQPGRRRQWCVFL